MQPKVKKKSDISKLHKITTTYLYNWVNYHIQALKKSEKGKPLISTRTLYLRVWVIFISTKTLTNWPNILQIIGFVDADSVHIGVPIVLAIANKILERQYSCERPCILSLTQTCADELV